MTKATETFVLMFDRFFDCMNVRHPKEWVTKKKPDLKPYTSTEDPRFEVCTRYYFLPLFSITIIFFNSGCKRSFSSTLMIGNLMLIATKTLLLSKEAK